MYSTAGVGREWSLVNSVKRIVGYRRECQVVGYRRECQGVWQCQPTQIQEVIESVLKVYFKCSLGIVHRTCQH